MSDLIPVEAIAPLELVRLPDHLDGRAHFAERDRWFRGIVTDAVMLHGYGLMLP